MLKNKTFLYGLGIGLIVGSILLQLMLGAQDLHDKKPATMSKALAKSKAEAYGYQVFAKDQQVYTQEQLDKSKNQAVQAAKAEAAKAAATAAAAQKNNKAQTAQPKEIVKQTWGFTITYSATASNVSAMLAEMGLIKDAKAFENRLRAKGLLDKLQVGYVVFDKKPTEDEIIAQMIKIKK